MVDAAFTRLPSAWCINCQEPLATAIPGGTASPFAFVADDRGHSKKLDIQSSIRLAIRHGVRDDSAMASLTVENYVKAVLQVQQKSGENLVSPGALATRLGVSPGSVTSMLKTLSESGLVSYVRYEGVELTDAGRKLAMRMLRRHRLIELFLHDTLNLTWDQVHEEAEELEHSVSEFLIDRIDEFLKHPETDPHGSPIPAANGQMRSDLSGTVALSSCEIGDKVRFVRVVNQEPDFLRYLSESGFQLGKVGEIIENSEDAGVIRAKIDEQTFTVGLRAAQSIRVERTT